MTAVKNICFFLSFSSCLPHFYWTDVRWKIKIPSDLPKHPVRYWNLMIGLFSGWMARFIRIKDCSHTPLKTDVMPGIGSVFFWAIRSSAAIFRYAWRMNKNPGSPANPACPVGMLAALNPALQHFSSGDSTGRTCFTGGLIKTENTTSRNQNGKDSGNRIWNR